MTWSDYFNFSLSIWAALTVWRVMSFLICSIRVKIPEIRYILCDKIYWRYRLKWNWLNGTRSSCFISTTIHVGVASCVGGLQYSVLHWIPTTRVRYATKVLHLHSNRVPLWLCKTFCKPKNIRLAWIWNILVNFGRNWSFHVSISQTQIFFESCNFGETYGCC